MISERSSVILLTFRIDFLFLILGRVSRRYRTASDTLIGIIYTNRSPSDCHRRKENRLVFTCYLVTRLLIIHGKYSIIRETTVAVKGWYTANGMVQSSPSRDSFFFRYRAFQASNLCIRHFPFDHRLTRHAQFIGTHRGRKKRETKQSVKGNRDTK